jgi:predicted acyl esterase
VTTAEGDGGAVEVRASPGEVAVVGPSGRHVEVRRGGAVLAAGSVDGFGDRLAGDLGVTDLVRGLGGVVLRGLPSGALEVLVEGEPARPIEVPALGALPADYEQRVLGQQLAPGYGYLETRDGTLLSVNVGLPDPDRWGPGPYPTVLQYSGYHPSRPDFLTGDPAHDTGMNTEANVCLHLGYAVVGVNMRGSGGSGGAFQLLGPLAGLDGHDAVEVVARQPWARRRQDGRPGVGMVGRSMPGYSQVLVASTRPPSLVAITPAAVGSHPYDALAPGGVTNSWLQARIGFWEIDPAPSDEVRSGAPIEPRRYEFWDRWLKDWIGERQDRTAARNQLLRGHNVDLRPLLAHHNTARAEDPLRIDIGAWAETVEASTLLMGTWQDQDSGSGFGMVPGRFPAATPVRVVAGNGSHEESRLSGSIARWTEFLALELREEAPAFSAEAQAYLDERYRWQFPDGLPVDRSPLEGRSSAAARDAWRATPPVAVLLELGAGRAGAPGYPDPAVVVPFEQWPPPAEPRRLRLGPAGVLDEHGPTAAGATSYRYDPRVQPPASAHDGFDANAPSPAYDWRPLVRDHSAAFVTEALDAPLLLVGPASLDVWIRCSATDVDLEVTVTEVRPDGQETFVQNGWLRASTRTLDEERSSELVPWLAEHRDRDEPLVPGAPAALRVPVGWFGHLFRAGSRLRVSVAAPGGNQPHWAFAARWPHGVDESGAAVEVEVLHGPEHPSALVVPVVAAEPPDGTWPPLPPVGSLRRQPCRRYVPEGIEVDPEVGPAPPIAPEPVPDAEAEAHDDDEAEVDGGGEGPTSPAPALRRSGLRRAAGRVRRGLGRVRRRLRRA